MRFERFKDLLDLMAVGEGIKYITEWIRRNACGSGMRNLLNRKEH